MTSTIKHSGKTIIRRSYKYTKEWVRLPDGREAMSEVRNIVDKEVPVYVDYQLTYDSNKDLIIVNQIESQFECRFNTLELAFKGQLDRIALYKKNLKNKIDSYNKQVDELKALIDLENKEIAAIKNKRYELIKSPPLPDIIEDHY